MVNGTSLHVGSETPFPKDPPWPIFFGQKNLENFSSWGTFMQYIVSKV